MGDRYHQLNIEERCEVARLRREGQSIRAVAASLDRSPSTIARELSRNASQTQGYRAEYAHDQARARRWGGSKLERDEDLREGVLSRLKRGWSPEQVCGSLALEAGERGRGRTRPSTGSSMVSWRGRRTTPGATTCRGRSPSAASAVAKVAVRHPSSHTAGRLRSAPRTRTTGRPPATGRRT